MSDSGCSMSNPINHPEKVNTNRTQNVAHTAINMSADKCNKYVKFDENFSALLAIYRVIKSDRLSNKPPKKPTGNWIRKYSFLLVPKISPGNAVTIANQ